MGETEGGEPESLQLEIIKARCNYIALNPQFGKAGVYSIAYQLSGT